MYRYPGPTALWVRGKGRGDRERLILPPSTRAALAAWQYGEGRAVDVGDTLPDGRAFANIAEFKKRLLANPEQLARCVTEKLVTYATGQPVGAKDRQAVNQILAEAKPSNYGLRTLLHAIVASALFRKK